MISLLLPVLALQQAQPETPDLTPAQFLSKVIFRYAEAKTLTGSIKCVSTGAGNRVEVLTTFAFERPSKVFLRQVRGGAVPEDSTITSDGKKFSYDAPYDYKQTTNERLMELVWKEGQKSPMSIGEIVQIGQRRLPDYSQPLWLMMSYRVDLEFMRGCWGKVSFQKKDKDLIIVGGAYKEYPLAAETGTWQLAATPEGDLTGYSIAMPMSDGKREIMLQNVWTVDAKINPEIPAETFRLKF